MTDASSRPLPARLADALGTAYTIEGEIGRGGMGAVYRARDERLQRRVAIKVLPPELAFQQDIRQRFTREAQTAGRISTAWASSPSRCSPASSRSTPPRAPAS